MAIGALLVVAGTGPSPAGDAPTGLSSALQWPRMRATDFGCMLERRFGVQDAVYGCGRDFAAIDWGDTCTDPDRYYAGPGFPRQFASRLDPAIDRIELSWEHGELQYVAIVFRPGTTRERIESAFGAKPGALPANVQHMDIQDVGKGILSLGLTGFDHMGAGDVDCDAAPDG